MGHAYRWPGVCGWLQRPRTLLLSYSSLPLLPWLTLAPPQAGMAYFPNTPALHLLYANYLLHVKADGPASRTQLQVCSAPCTQGSLARDVTAC